MQKRLKLTVICFLILMHTVVIAAGADGEEAIDEVELPTEVLLNPLYPHEEGEYEELLQKLEELGSQKEGMTEDDQEQKNDLEESDAFAEKTALEERFQMICSGIAGGLRKFCSYLINKTRLYCGG